MPDYQNAKIYKLVGNGKIYIGSTTQQLCSRKAGHMTAYKCNHQCTSCYIVTDSNHYIELIEYFPCNNKEELQKRERYYIENTECVNKIIPGRTHKEYRDDNKNKIAERMRQYQKDNKDKIAERMRQYQKDNKDKIVKYYEVNKDKRAEKAKLYREANKDKIAERQKKYQKDNKDKIAERQKKYQKDNKDKIAEKKRKYYKDNTAIL